MPARTAIAAALAASLGALAGLALDRTAPPPAADVARGSEEAFAEGLYRRELPPGREPLRWTRRHARVSFERLPAGPVRVEVRVAGHQAPVSVVAGGVVLARLAPGQRGGVYPLPALRRSRLVVELSGSGFAAGDGRQLGTQLQRVSVQHAPAPGSVAVALLVALPALVLFAAARVAGFGPVAGLGWSGLGTGIALVALWPEGLVRSSYAPALAATLSVGAGLAATFAWWQGRRRADARRWGFAALLICWWLLAIAAASPVMVVSDAVFHANKLAQVAAGELFPTSVTQHERAFRIPYGPLFYLLLAPFERLGADGVALVRWGAALSAVAASAALFVALAPRGGAPLAGAATLALQLLPGWFSVHSFGNLSNAFGQSLTVAFVAWWLGRAPRAWPLGAGLLAAAALSHLSAAIVAGAVSLALLALAPRDERRRRLLAVGVGLGVAALYYACFAPLILEQLPRMIEGGGQGRGASRDAWGALRLQLLGALGQWGWPAVLLAAVGAPRLRGDVLERTLVAFWMSGLLLAVIAVVTPVEVRYLYALTLPLAIGAARGSLRGWAAGVAGRAAVVGLIGVQIWQACAEVGEAVARRYRP